MTLAGVVLVAVAAVVAALLSWRAPTSTRLRWSAALPTVLLFSAGVLVLLGTGGGPPPSRGLVAVVWPSTVVLASLGGGPVVERVLGSAVRRRGSTDAVLRSSAQRATSVLKGGYAIGVLERAAVALCLLVGLPAGVAVVIAVKGLGRFAELKDPDASERFIIGTLVSLLWAASVAGIGAVLLGVDVAGVARP